MNLQRYFDQYSKSHQHPANRFFHALGIPTILVSIVMLLSMDERTLPWWIFGLGWGFQLVGHAIERTVPEFLKNPLFLIIGPLYFLDKIRKKKSATRC